MSDGKFEYNGGVKDLRGTGIGSTQWFPTESELKAIDRKRKKAEDSEAKLKKIGLIAVGTLVVGAITAVSIFAALNAKKEAVISAYDSGYYAGYVTKSEEQAAIEDKQVEELLAKVEEYENLNREITSAKNSVIGSADYIAESLADMSSEEEGLSLQTWGFQGALESADPICHLMLSFNISKESLDEDFNVTFYGGEPYYPCEISYNVNGIYHWTQGRYNFETGVFETPIAIADGQEDENGNVLSVDAVDTPLFSKLQELGIQYDVRLKEFVSLPVFCRINGINPLQKQVEGSPDLVYQSFNTHESLAAVQAEVASGKGTLAHIITDGSNPLNDSNWFLVYVLPLIKASERGFDVVGGTNYGR